MPIKPHVCLIIALMLLPLAACTHAPRKDSTAFDGHPSGAAVFIRKAAADTWLYAQLASTAYDDERRFELPHHVTPATESVTRRTGFKARAFHVRQVGSDPYIVIAYAGTEGLGDWIFGNLNPLQTQGRQGLAFLQSISREHPGLRIVVTGHSLGGAISKYVATRVPDVRAYVFNPSLVATSGPYAGVDTVFSVSQYAEALGVLRKPLPNGSGTYTTLGCHKAGPVKRHSIRLLAECLTHIAAWESTEAEESLQLNGLGPRRRIDTETNTLKL